MVRSIFMSLIILSGTCAAMAQVDLLFEGYSKIISGDQHIGYVISRYEYDNKAKQFISTYFLKTGKGPTEVTESLRALSNTDLNPISYEYTTLAGKDSKTIDAKFKGGTMTATVNLNGKIQRVEKKIPKGTFLSTFLVYLMLKSKDGLKAETNYQYQAIAEEEADIFEGSALVGKEETFKGLKAFKVLNTFEDKSKQKKNKFLSYVNERGEVLGTDALGQNIRTELVATPSEATVGQSYSSTLLKTLFKNIPAGEANVASRSRQLEEKKSQAPAPTKQMGVPAGQGLIIKAQPEKEESSK
ncbi:MAG: hypothetical protein AAGB31_13435 [Bdellovibrio sp.]